MNQEDLSHLNRNRVSRRRALSTAAKVGIGVVVAGIVAGAGGYFAGSSTAPSRETTVTKTATVTQTVGGGGVQTVTQTATVTQTRTVTSTVTAAPPTEVKPQVSLTFASPEWLPGRLTDLIAKGFPQWSAAKIGKGVEVKVDQIPWGSYHDRLATLFAAKSKEPSLLISDSQWIGEFFVGGHIRRLNDIIDKDPELQQLVNRFDDSFINYYMTYPQGNRNNIVGFNHEGDNLLITFREDLFSNPGERENFKAEYGYDLPLKYEDWYPSQLDWYQLRDIAKFFNRKAGDELAGKRLDADFYGIAVHWSKEYDAIACVFGTMLYVHGEYWWDPVTGELDGYINSDRAVKALEFYKSLTNYSAPNALELWFDGVNSLMQAGRVAMIYNWAGFLPSLFDPAASKVYNVIKVVPPPGHKGDDGIYRRYSNIGGQPMCINAYTDYPEEALAFIKYWFEPEQQRKWAEGGGGVCLKDIVNTAWFRELTPYNRAYADSIPFQVDFWNVPFFFEMLTVVQEEIHGYLSGSIGDARTALNNIARRQREIIEREGYPEKFKEFGEIRGKTPADVIRAGEPMSEVGKPK